jgi:hypothetical protein
VIRIMVGFGLGWQVGTFHGTPVCSHGGGYAGTATYYAILPEKKCGFALLMNAGGAAGGLQDVIAVDILDRLIEGDERIDVLEAYRKRVVGHKRDSAARSAQLAADLARPLELSRPASAYGGRYLSPDLGTMTFSPDGQRLKVVMGECELDVSPAGPNSFMVLGPTFEGARCEFVVSPKGNVTAVGVDLPDEKTLRFERSGRSATIGDEKPLPLKRPGRSAAVDDERPLPVRRAAGNVTIDDRSFPYYPGVLLSLRKARVIVLPKRIDELKAVEADLWIEPRDPEIAALTAAAAKQLGITRQGGDARVALTEDAYDAIVQAPGQCTWLDQLPARSIVTGLVQSSENRFFKVRIDAWDKSRGGGLMRLSFDQIREP